MFCRSCGKELIGPSESCPNCGAKLTAGTDFCPECGAPTTPLTDTCPKCGAQLANAARQKTWKTRAAGILAIVAGALGLAQWVTVAAIEIPVWGWVPMGGGLIGILGTALVAVEIAVGIVAVVGGLYALKTRRWRLALAGSICAFFSFFLFFWNVPLAIAAIVLVVLGRSEFD
jgi:hypothetical protein